MVTLVTRFKGAVELAKKTSYSHQYVSLLLSQGHTPAQILDRAAARDSGQMRPLAGRAAGSTKRRGVAAAGTKDGKVVTNPAKQGYVPSRMRGVGPVSVSKSKALPKFVPAPDPIGSAALREMREVRESQVARTAGVGGVSGTTRELPPEPQGENLQQAILRKEIALADQREMENEVRSGELVLRGHMANWLGTGIVTCRDWLRRIPQELRDRIAVEIDPVRCEEMMQQAVDEVLERTADYFRELAAGGEDTEAVV